MEKERQHRRDAEIENALLSAMKTHSDVLLRTKCDVILRLALHNLGKWSEEADYALCNSGDEEPETWKFYGVLRQLIRDGYAEGAGDLNLPAGPRYTECRITAKGLERLESE